MTKASEQKLKNGLETKFNNLVSQMAILRADVDELKKVAEKVRGLIPNG